MEEKTIKITSPMGRTGGAVTSPSGRMGGAPRGFRNNNPLNIRLGVSHWQHQAKIQTDPAFVVFDEMKWGYRAAWKLMDSYRLRLTSEGKPFNIHNIIRRWAPPNENDTSAYIQRVVKISGIPEFQQLSDPGKKGDDLVKILKGMTIVENGIKEEQVPMEAIIDGYWLAFPYGWIEGDRQPDVGSRGNTGV